MIFTPVDIGTDHEFIFQDGLEKQNLDLHQKPIHWIWIFGGIIIIGGIVGYIIIHEKKKEKKNSK